MGYTNFETKQLIAQCVIVEIFEAVKSGKPYDEKRYIKNLEKLPEELFDE